MYGLPAAASQRFSVRVSGQGGPRTSGRESKADVMAFAAVRERATRSIRRTAPSADPGAINGVPARFQRGDQDELQEAARQNAFGGRRDGDAFCVRSLAELSESLQSRNGDPLRVASSFRSPPCGIRPPRTRGIRAGRRLTDARRPYGALRANGLPSGSYVYRLEAAGEIVTRVMTLSR